MLHAPPEIREDVWDSALPCAWSDSLQRIKPYQTGFATAVTRLSPQVPVRSATARSVIGRGPARTVLNANRITLSSLATPCGTFHLSHRVLYPWHASTPVWCGVVPAPHTHTYYTLTLSPIVTHDTLSPIASASGAHPQAHRRARFGPRRPTSPWAPQPSSWRPRRPPPQLPWAWGEPPPRSRRPPCQTRRGTASAGP